MDHSLRLNMPVIPPTDLLACEGHPSLLDRLAIATPRGQLMAMFGLGAELYVAPYDRKQLRLDMLDVQEDYYLRFKDHIDRYLVDDVSGDGKILKLTGNPIPEVRNLIGDWPSDQGYQSVLFKRYVHPDFPRNGGTVTPWVGSFLVSSARNNRFSHYASYLPVSNGQGGLHFDTLRECVLAWATRLKPAHGQAGFSVILEVGSISGQPYTYATLQRHPGLDIHAPVPFVMETKGIFNRIKCVNWLTVLGEPILEELGGIEAARRALEPDCTLYPYPGGLLIQAGPLPQLGDTHRGLIPERYRKVAQFTRTVRFEAYSQSGLFGVFKPLEERDEVLKWITRFD